MDNESYQYSVVDELAALLDAWLWGWGAGGLGKRFSV